MSLIPTSEEVYERIYKGPENPGEEWLAETAKLIYRFPFCLGETLVWNPKGFLLYPLHLLLEETDCKKTTIWASLQHMVSNHLGLLIYTASGSPLWELTHGHILSWKLHGTPFPSRFFSNPPGPPENAEVLSAGAPNDQMLPPLVRDSIRWAMKERIGIEEPKVGFVVTAAEPRLLRILFDLSPKTLGGEDAALEAYQLLTWYMPPSIPTVHMPGQAGAGYMVPL